MAERFETTVVACMVALGILLMGYSIAHSHDWYERETRDAEAPNPTWGCCGGKDCKEIAGKNVTERRGLTGEGGYWFMIAPGEHPMVKNEPAQIFVPYRRVRPVREGTGWHICLDANLNVLCCWGPVGGT